MSGLVTQFALNKSFSVERHVNPSAHHLCVGVLHGSLRKNLWSTAEWLYIYDTCNVLCNATCAGRWLGHKCNGLKAPSWDPRMCVYVHFLSTSHFGSPGKLRKTMITCNIVKFFNRFTGKLNLNAFSANTTSAYKAVEINWDHSHNIEHYVVLYVLTRPLALILACNIVLFMFFLWFRVVLLGENIFHEVSIVVNLLHSLCICKPTYRCMHYVIHHCLTGLLQDACWARAVSYGARLCRCTWREWRGRCTAQAVWACSAGRWTHHLLEHVLQNATRYVAQLSIFN